MNKKILHLFPFYYDFAIRQKFSLQKIVGYFLLFSYIPLYLILFKDSNIFSTISTYLIAVVMYNFIYELGHIYNDIFAIKHEKHPTIKHNFLLEKKEFISILFSRTLIFILVLFLTKNLFADKVIFAVILLILYSIHNSSKEHNRTIPISLLRVWKIFWILSFFVFSYNEIIIFFFIHIAYNFLEVLGYSIRRIKRKGKSYIKKYRIFTEKKEYYVITLFICTIINIIFFLTGNNIQAIFDSYYITYIIPRLKTLVGESYSHKN